MKRNSAMAPLAPQFSSNPFLVWTGFALKTAEMMAASAQVISHRTGRMARAGVLPDARDRREFALMGQEKLEAAAESAQAMALRMILLNMQLGTILFRQMADAASGMLSLAGSRTLLQGSALQGKLFQDAIVQSSKAASQLGDSVARLAHHGLKPIHSRATANARRLAKLKK